MTFNFLCYNITILRRKKHFDMNDRYLRILVELESRGIDMEANISDFMYKMFTDQPDLTYDKNIAIESTPDGYIIRMVDTMKSNCHLSLSRKPNPNNPDRQLIEGRITDSGLEYLNNYRLTQSTLGLNDRLKKNLRNQIIIGILTLSAIAATAYYDGKNYNKSEPISLKRLDTLLQQIVKQSDSTLQLQKERNKYLRIMAKKH